jgi:hypothetical protein
LSGYFLGEDFSTSTGDWVGRGSAGSSGLLSFTYYAGGGIPSTDTTTSGKIVPRVGTTAAAQGFYTAAMSDFFTSTSATLVIAQKIYSSSTDVGDGTDGCVVADTSGFLTISARNTGPTIRTNLDNGVTVATDNVGTSWHVYSMRYDASLNKFETRINHGAWQTITKTTAWSVAAAIYFGFNPNNGNYLNMSYGCILSSDSALSDADIYSLEQFAANYVGGITLL